MGEAKHQVLVNQNGTSALDTQGGRIHIEWDIEARFMSSRPQKAQMTIKFEKETRRLKMMIRLSGRLQSKHLGEMKLPAASCGVSEN